MDFESYCDRCETAKGGHWSSHAAMVMIVLCYARFKATNIYTDLAVDMLGSQR